MRADLVTFGKIIGGGMPVGAYAGSRALMEQVAPCGPVYQAGTLSGNPVAMAAGLAQLTILADHPEVYTVMETVARYIANHLRESAKRHGVALQVNQIGSLLCPYFTEQPVDCFAAAQESTQNYTQSILMRCYCEGCILRPASSKPCSFPRRTHRTTWPARCRRWRRVLLRSHRGLQKHPIRKDVPTLRLQRGVLCPAHSILSAWGWARRTG